METELLLALSKKDTGQLNSLLVNNRSGVKQFVLSLSNEAIIKELNGAKEESARTLNDALSIAQKYKDVFNEGCLINITNSYLNWTIEEKLKKIEADSLNNLGSELRLYAETREEAINCFNKAIELFSEINDDYGQAIALGGLGFIYFYRDADSALVYYLKALESRQKIDDKSLTGATLNSIGSVYLQFFNDYERAIEYYKKAAAVRSEIGDWGNLGITLIYEASAYEEMGQLDKAVEVYNQSYNINILSGNSPLMAQAMLHSGYILNIIGNYDQAINDLEVSLEVYRELNDTLGLGDVLLQMGYVYTNLGDYTRSIELYSEALSMYDGRDSWGTAGVYNNMGITYQNAKRYDKALEYYSYALEYFEALGDISNTIVTLNNIGTINFDLGNYEEAEENNTRALSLSRGAGERVLELLCLINLANAQNRLQKLDTAFSNYQSGLILAESHNNPIATWKLLVGLAENYKLRGNIIKAIEYNERGLAIVEEIRKSIEADEFKSTYLAQERYAFEDVINMLGELHLNNPGEGYDKKAFQIAEQSKSRALLDLLSEPEQEILVNQDGPDPGQIQAVQPLLLEEVQSGCLEQNTLLIEYSLGDANSWLWVVDRSNHYMFKLPGRDTLQELVEPFRFALENQNNNDINYFIETSNRLYKILVEPVEQFLDGSSHLVIVPEGVLNYLPFEALLTVRNSISSGSSFSDLPYMVLKYPISYVQSASVLNNLILNNNTNKSDFKYDLVAFGDPLYGNIIIPGNNGGDDLGRLLFSSQEVENIAQFFPDERSKVFLREQATESNLKSGSLLSDCRYLHFATHGIIDEKNPDLSSIVLSQHSDQTEDGYLRAEEIFRLKTGASLVVLSACQTGLGRMIRGEGMVGLTRAFMYAGAPSVLVSLWSVSDASTADLMVEFYRSLVDNNLTKTEAHRQAQISMISDENYAHPFYWAPFILIGNWR